MKPLMLNHLLVSRRSTLLASTLFAMGVGLSILLYLYTQHLSNETELLKDSLRQSLATSEKPYLRRASVQSSHRAVTDVDSEVTRMNNAIHETMLPWTALFKSLESLNNTEVHLVEFEPNAKKKMIEIVAVAIDTESMMRYVNALSQLNTISEVTLQNQESTEVSGQHMIRFAVGAVWQI